jgi:hypothetical protein
MGGGIESPIYDRGVGAGRWGSVVEILEGQAVLTGLRCQRGRAAGDKNSLKVFFGDSLEVILNTSFIARCEI